MKNRGANLIKLNIAHPVFACAALLWASCASASTLETGGSPLVFGAAGEGARSYARTARQDFAKSSFQAEVTVRVNPGEGAGCAYFGLGRGEANPGKFNEPYTAPALYCRLAPSGFAGGVVTVSANGMDDCQGSSSIGDGTHRVRLTWDAAKKRAMFEICRKWDGRRFQADSSATVNVENLNFGEDGHLFAGGAGRVSFSDFAVKPMSGADIQAAGFGENFAHDPTAGTWLPATPPPKDAIRLLACWYDAAKLAATRTFTHGVAQTPGSRWQSTASETPVAGDPTARDLDVTFKLTDGVAKSAGVAVAFDFTNWSTGNYVLIPASVYNGNRNRIEHRGYASGLDRADLYKKDLQLTTSDLPQLSPDPDKPSKLEVSACNATTPAMCFYNHQTKQAFILLAEQGIPQGDHIIDNVFSIEESPDRSHATFVVSAPGVRERKPEFIGFSASPDRGIDWQPGSEVHMHLRIYSFEASGIPALLDKFMTVRKAVTGPNHPRNLIPFSEIVKEMSRCIDGEYYNGKDNQFYTSCNAPWITFGWVGGLMNTFPMLALDDATHLDKVSKTFDFAFKYGIGKAGYLYGVIDSNGKVVAGQESYPEIPALVLPRRNGDVLYWMIKQFLLLKAQGRGDAIKPEWEQATRGIADAFVATWKKEGQWGHRINADTGEIAIYNTSSGVTAIGGLAMAAKYFNQPEYLQVAEEAARFYYQRDFVNLGMTTGGCSDIEQNADSETAAGFMCSLMALYETTGDPQWLEASRQLANLCATWTVSYDYVLPPQTELARLGAKLAGAVWASTQNKHSAPGFCTSSGDSLFKIYRATGDTRYADLIHDVAHAHTEGMQPGGATTERLGYCDVEERGSRLSGGHTPWNELNGILMAMELPGIYLRVDKPEMYVFDHVQAEVQSRDAGGITVKITNPTKFDAKVTVFAENGQQAHQPLGVTAFIHWPSVSVTAGGTTSVRVSPTGQLQQMND